MTSKPHSQFEKGLYVDPAMSPEAPAAPESTALPTPNFPLGSRVFFRNAQGGPAGSIYGRVESICFDDACYPPAIEYAVRVEGDGRVEYGVPQRALDSDST